MDRKIFTYCQMASHLYLQYVSLLIDMIDIVFSLICHIYVLTLFRRDIFTARQHSIGIYASAVLAMVGMSVCLSISPSVTRWYCIKNLQARITKYSLMDNH